MGDVFTNTSTHSTNKFINYLYKSNAWILLVNTTSKIRNLRQIECIHVPIITNEVQDK